MNQVFKLWSTVSKVYIFITNDTRARVYHEVATHDERVKKSAWSLILLANDSLSVIIGAFMYMRTYILHWSGYYHHAHHFISIIVELIQS